MTYRVRTAGNFTRECPTGIEDVGHYPTLAAARRAAKQAVAGPRGATACGLPSCADDRAIEAFAGRDDEDGPIAYIEED